MYDVFIRLTVFISITCFFVYFIIKDEEELIWAGMFFSKNRKKAPTGLTKFEKRMSFLDIFIDTAHEAGFNTSHIEYFIISLLIGAVFAMLGFVLTNYIPSMLIAGIVGLFVPHMYFSNKKLSRARVLAAQMSPFLKQMANYLRSGNSKQQAIEKLLPSLQNPLSDIMSEVVAKINMGAPMVAVLKQVGGAIPLFEFRMFIILVEIHSEMGGNLADSLDTLSNTIDEKKKLRDMVERMTSETRTSAYVTAAMPVVMFIIFRFVSPEYTATLTETRGGKLGLLISFTLIGFGVFLTRKISDVKIDQFYR